MKPSEYIQSSDYLSIGSDGNPTATLTIPGSISILTGTTWSISTTVSVPSQYNGKALRINMNYSKSPDYYYGTTLYAMDTDSTGYPYYILVQASRISASELSLTASIFNNKFPASTITTNSVGGLITAEVRTLVIS